MSAEDIYELLQPKIKRLNKTEKKRLYYKIFSEGHPAFGVMKKSEKKESFRSKRKAQQGFSGSLFAGEGVEFKSNFENQ